MSFTNSYSYKCLLGVQTKKYEEVGPLLLWSVGEKKHFSAGGKIDQAAIDYLKDYAPSNFHYIDQDNMDILKNNFKISRSKGVSVILNIKDFSLSGSNMRTLRQTYNKCYKNNFEILDNYKDINDVKRMLKEWSNDYSDKYFRDFSGKNLYFFKNNFHKDCSNTFIYYNNELVSFGILSPEVNGESAYIIRKALYKKLYGLSEYTDIIVYKKAIEQNISLINMGRAATKGLLFYKGKFPNSIEELYYDGNINNISI